MAKIAKKEISEVGVVFKFEDGKDFTALLDGIPQEIVNRLALHGMSQKLGDSYASAMSIKEAREGVTALYNALKEGSWTLRGESGPRITVWVQALARAAKVTEEEALKKWDEMKEEDRKALKNHPGMKAAKAEIDLEKAQKAMQGAEMPEEGADLSKLF